jgi:hypothetical protein
MEDYLAELPEVPEGEEFGFIFDDFAHELHHHSTMILPPTPFATSSFLPFSSSLDRVPEELRDLPNVEVYEPLTKPRVKRVDPKGEALVGVGLV